MVDPSTYYETEHMAVVTELAEKHGHGMWLVCAQRRQSAQFIGVSTVAWCDSMENAQTLARMLIGIEITREGAAIWPDGRTKPDDPARDLIRRLLEWGALMGEWESPIWGEARAFLGDPEPEEEGEQ